MTEVQDKGTSVSKIIEFFRRPDTRPDDLKQRMMSEGLSFHKTLWDEKDGGRLTVDTPYLRRYHEWKAGVEAAGFVSAGRGSQAINNENLRSYSQVDEVFVNEKTGTWVVVDWTTDPIYLIPENTQLIFAELACQAEALLDFYSTAAPDARMSSSNCHLYLLVVEPEKVTTKKARFTDEAATAFHEMHNVYLYLKEAL